MHAVAALQDAAVHDRFVPLNRSQGEADRDEIQDRLVGGQGERGRCLGRVEAADGYGGKSAGGRLEQDVLGGVAGFAFDERLGSGAVFAAGAAGCGGHHNDGGGRTDVGLPECGGFQLGAQVWAVPDLNPVALRQVVHHFRGGHHVEFERVQGACDGRRVCRRGW